MSIRYNRVIRTIGVRLFQTGLILLFFIVSAGMAEAQNERWTAHTSMRRIQALTVSSNHVWAATSGGIFSYDPASGEIVRYTVAEGMHGTDTRAIAFDPTCNEGGCVWVGYADGVLDQLDLSDGTVRSFHDIARATRFPSREINRLVKQGDSLLVATSFGLVVFDMEKGEVRDTYSQLGSFQPGIPVYDVVVAPLDGQGQVLWLGTDEGIARAPLGSVNLTDPSAWTVETAVTGSLSVASFNGAIYVGTNAGLFRRETDTSYVQAVNGTAFNNLFATPDVLLAREQFNLVAIDATGSARTTAVGGYGNPIDVVYGPAGKLWFADAAAGLVQAVYQPTGSSVLNVEDDLYPAGPYDNVFTEVLVDEAGVLWVGGGTEGGNGFYRRDAEGQWTDFIGRQYSALQNRSSFTRIFEDSEGGVWAAGQGSSLAHVTPDGEVEVFDRSNSSLRKPEGDNSSNEAFILIGAAGEDKDGNIWVTNRAAAQALHVRTPDGTWKGFAVPTCGGMSASNASFDRLFIDSFDQKWITVVNKQNLRLTIGLAVIDTGADPLDASDDHCRFFSGTGSSGQGLPSASVNAVTEDRDGYIWVATDDGPAYMINTGIVASDNSAMFLWPQNANRGSGSAYLLFGIPVYDIAVDPANRLWIAAEDGVRLVQAGEGGFDVVNHYTISNSPLFSNTVSSIAVDGTTGEVYFSTDDGLISVQGQATAPASTADDLTVYPNPARLEGDGPFDIFIEGLVEETEVMIVTPAGDLVKRFDARGGRAHWDGLDHQNRIVPSGVYLVVAIGQDGEGTAYGKVAVIR